ncbi:MAG: hypothetical protein COA43_13450 [Robiginitomaculum sp.]|nr:MAG: hypothetical protein COA43_13450 [Robiginitomaculum sp.]
MLNYSAVDNAISAKLNVLQTGYGRRLRVVKPVWMFTIVFRLFYAGIRMFIRKAFNVYERIVKRVFSRFL